MVFTWTNIGQSIAGYAVVGSWYAQVNDNTGLADFDFYSITKYKTILDDIGLSDVFYKLAQLIILEDIYSSEILAQSKTFFMADSIASNDVLYRDKITTAIDYLVLADILLLLTRDIYFTESFGLSDYNFVDKGFILTDAIAVADVNYKGRTFTVSDTSSASDAMFKFRYMSTYDSISASESPIYLNALMAILDSIALADEIAKGRILLTEDSVLLDVATIRTDKGILTLDVGNLAEVVLRDRDYFSSDSLYSDDILANYYRILSTADAVGLLDYLLGDVQFTIADIVSITTSIMLGKALEVHEDALLTEGVYKDMSLIESDATSLLDALAMPLKTGLVFDTLTAEDILLRDRDAYFTDSLGLEDLLWTDRIIPFLDSIGTQDNNIINKILYQYEDISLTDILVKHRYTNVIELIESYESIINNKEILIEDNNELIDIVSFINNIFISEDFVVKDWKDNDNIVGTAIVGQALIDNAGSTILVFKNLIFQDDVSSTDVGAVDEIIKLVLDYISGAESMGVDKAVLLQESVQLIISQIIDKYTIVLDVSGLLDEGTAVKDVSITDGLEVSDISLVDRPINMVESIGLSDVALFQVGTIKLIRELVNLTEAIYNDKATAISEAIVLYEQILKGANLYIFDGVNLVEYLKTYRRLLVTETFGMADLIYFVGGTTMKVAESIGMSDVWSINKSLVSLDTVYYLDQILAYKEVRIVDAIYYAEVMAFLKYILVGESVACDDFIKILKVLKTSDVLQMQDAILSTPRLAILKEDINLAEVFKFYKALKILETLNVSDDIHRELVGYIVGNLLGSDVDAYKDGAESVISRFEGNPDTATIDGSETEWATLLANIDRKMLEAIKDIESTLQGSDVDPEVIGALIPQYLLEGVWGLDNDTTNELLNIIIGGGIINFETVSTQDRALISKGLVVRDEILALDGVHLNSN